MTAIRKRHWISPKGEAKSAWYVDYRDQAGTRRSKQFARKKDADNWVVSAAWQVMRFVYKRLLASQLAVRYVCLDCRGIIMRTFIDS